MKILVVDDHPLILAALGQLLPRGERPLSVIGAGDRDEAYAMLAAHPDCALVLLDLALRAPADSSCWARCGATSRDCRSPCFPLRTTAPQSTPRWPPVREATSPRRRADAISCSRSNGCWTGAAAPSGPCPRARSAGARHRDPAGRTRTHPPPNRRARAPRAGQAQQADLPGPETLRGDGQGARVGDPYRH